MSYGKAVKCDICERVEIIDDNMVSFMDGFDGWIRLAINKPRRYGWDTSGEKATVTDTFDCCSISCAQTVLYDAAKSIADGSVSHAEGRS